MVDEKKTCRVLFSKMTHQFSVDTATTLADLKHQLWDREGVPTDQQDWRPVYRNPWTLWLTNYCGPQCTNDAQLIHLDSTRAYSVSLHLKEAEHHTPGGTTSVVVTDKDCRS